MSVKKSSERRRNTNSSSEKKGKLPKRRKLRRQGGLLGLIQYSKENRRLPAKLVQARIFATILNSIYYAWRERNQNSITSQIDIHLFKEKPKLDKYYNAFLACAKLIFEAHGKVSGRQDFETTEHGRVVIFSVVVSNLQSQDFDYKLISRELSAAQATVKAFDSRVQQVRKRVLENLNQLKKSA